MTHPQVEELLEELYVRQFEQDEEVSGDISDRAVAEAERLHLIRLDDGLCHLTEAGLAAARDVVRRHRLAECLLHDVLEVTHEQMEHGACQFEHILQRGLDEKICILLGHPTTCPHGKPIPPGRCCTAFEAPATGEVYPLCDAAAGQEGTVAYLSTRRQQEVQKLMVMGVLPGVRISLIRRFPSYVFQVGYSQFTVDRSLAEKIYVHWRRPPGRRARRRFRRRRRGRDDEAAEASPPEA